MPARVNSGYLPRPDSIAVAGSGATLAVPILQFHGDADTLVRLDYARAGTDRVVSLGFSDVTFRTLPGVPHSVTRAELLEAAEWLARVLPAPSAASDL